MVTALEEHMSIDGPFAEPTVISLPNGSQRRDSWARQVATVPSQRGGGSRYPREMVFSGGPRAIPIGHQTTSVPTGLQQPVDYLQYIQGPSEYQQPQRYGGSGSQHEYGNQQPGMGAVVAEPSAAWLFNNTIEAFSGAGIVDLPSDMEPLNSDDYIPRLSGFDAALSNPWVGSKASSPVTPESIDEILR